RAEEVAAPRPLEPAGGGHGKGEQPERDVVVDGLGPVELEVEETVGARLIGTKTPRAPPTQSQLIISVWTISPTPMVAMAK
ncbi:MAG TPA: hypothetical protein VGD07_12145, partial [Methylomirabilota bacterium]